MQVISCILRSFQFLFCVLCNIRDFYSPACVPNKGHVGERRIDLSPFDFITYVATVKIKRILALCKIDVVSLRFTLFVPMS